VCADDAVVTRLAESLRTHAAWRAAARYVAAEGESAVYFSHRPGEPWRFVRRAGESRLERGRAADPDFAFRFTPEAITELAAVEGGFGDVAVVLFELIASAEPPRRVEFRIVAPFWRLVLRGYLRLLLAAGPRVVAFGATHGVRTVTALARLVADLRRREPADWECG
jgi:hypothetical protein